MSSGSQCSVSNDNEVEMDSDSRQDNEEQDTSTHNNLGKKRAMKTGKKSKKFGKSNHKKLKYQSKDKYS